MYADVSTGSPASAAAQVDAESILFALQDLFLLSAAVKGYRSKPACGQDFF
jgi:hypothetical protein